MAKQRPNLEVQASPVSTYVASVAPAVELYDQQTVNLALQFADAFKDLSLTAANFAGTLKKQSNEQEILKGMNLVSESRKSYKALTESGEIKPTENPWMALGAQQASGTMEGMKARAHFQSVYDKRSQEDPAFFDSPMAFDALASQYAKNVSDSTGNAPYLSRAFFEAFDPYVATMKMKHEEQVTEVRNRRVLVGVGMEFQKAVQDSGSSDPIIKENALASMQEAVDNYVQIGYSPKQINEAIVDNFIQMATTSDDVAEAEKLFAQVKSGTGFLKDTEYAKTSLFANKGKIENNKNRMTVKESRQFYEWWNGLKPMVLKGQMTEDDAIQKFNELVEGPNASITLSGPEAESKRAWILSEIKQGREQMRVAEEQSNKEHLMNLVQRGTTIPEDFAGTDEEYKENLQTAMRFFYDEYQISALDRMNFDDLFERQWAQSAKARNLQRLNRMEESLWRGLPNQEGLDAVSERDITNFFGLDSSVPQESRGMVPNFNQYKDRIDSIRSDMGITPNSSDAKDMYLNDYKRFNDRLKVVEARFGDTSPKTDDTEEVRRNKTQIRSRFRFLRMKLGSVFGSNEEAISAVRDYNTALTPLNAEKGENMAGFEDALESYRMAVANGVPLDQVVVNPESPNGKRMLNEIRWSLGQISANKTPTDIARDLARGRVFGEELGTDFFSRDNPLGWLQFNSGSGVDAAEFNTSMVQHRSDMGITEPDASMYHASEYWKHYQEAIRGVHMGDGRKASRYAAEKVSENNIFYNGSMIPNVGLKDGGSAAMIYAVLKTRYPNIDNPTLAVVYRNADGSALLALRKDGNAVSDEPIQSRDLNPTAEDLKNPEFIKAVTLGTSLTRPRPQYALPEVPQAKKPQGMRPTLTNFDTAGTPR